MTRILFTSDAVGGVWTYTLELIRALAPHGVEALVAVMGPEPNAAQRKEFSRLKNARLHCGPYALEWMDKPWAEVDAASAWLLQLAEDFAPDVIHLNGYAHADLDWPAPVLVVAHSCVLTWWQSVFGKGAPARVTEYERRVKAGLRAADLVVTPTRAFREQLQKAYGLRLRGGTIHNARCIAKNHACPREDFIFCAGRLWDRAKNIALLEQIAPMLDLPVVVAGDTHTISPPGEQPQFIGRLAEAEVFAHLARASIYAAPAFYEPFGLSILEAALSGCALVLSDLPTLRELWDGCAVFLPPHDEEAWARALNDLARDAARLESLRFLAQARARRYAPQRQAIAYLELYRQLRAAVRPELFAA